MRAKDDRPLGVGIVGVGMVADTNVRALMELGDIAYVTSAYARDRGRLTAFCDPRGIAPAASLSSLIDDPGTDVLLVLTPPNARTEIVAAAAAAGKHVLLEKPIERTLDAAEAIVATAEEAGITLGVMFQNRFRENAARLKTMADSGAFGRLAAVRIDVAWWRPQSYYDVPGRGTYERDGGGVLINQAIHTLDLVGTYAGPVRSVQAMAATTALHRMEAEDFVVAGLEFANGAVGSLVATTAAYPGSPETIALHYEQATVTMRPGLLEIQHLDGGTEMIEEVSGTGGGADPMAFPHGWHRDAQRDFLEAVRDGHPPVVSGRTALGVHRLIDALVRSARDGMRVSVKQDAG